jgi:two-component system chemotaxis response regulator CheB
VKRVRVLVVDDSFVCREQLRELLQAEGDISVVGEAGTGEEAVDRVRVLRPDVTTMDVHMPGLGGLEAIEQIMAKTPVPILVITSRPAGAEQNLAFEAVRRGALDLVEKPGFDDDRAAERLRSFVRRFADVRVVRHMAGNRVAAGIEDLALPRSLRSPRVPSTIPSRAQAPDLTVVGIGASAGGPSTVASVLSRIPKDIKAAFALVQHLPTGFTDSFAEYLSRSIPLPVRVVRSATRLEPGVVFLAEDDHHLAIASPHTIASLGGPRVGGHRPSVTTLFQSLAEVLGPHGVGVILSGMGSDGAQGMRKMSNAGAYTIAQDQATSVVYGMPKAAVEAGGVKTVLPVDLIPPVLIAWLGSPRSSGARGGHS